MKDMARDVKIVQSIVPAALAADNTPGAIDRRGYETVLFEINVGVGGITFDATNKIEFKLTASDDDVTYAAVADADVVIVNPDGTLGAVGSGGIVRSLIAPHAAGTVTRVGYIGSKRYTKMLSDFSGTHGAATPISVSAILANPHIKPVS